MASATWRLLRWPAGFAAGLLIDELLFSASVWGAGDRSVPPMVIASLVTAVGAGVAVWVIRERGWVVGLLYASVKQLMVVVLMVGMGLAEPYHPEGVSLSASAVGGSLRQVYSVGGAGLVLALVAALPVGMLGGHLVAAMTRVEGQA